MAWYDALFGNTPGLDEEQKRMMLGRAMLSGAAGIGSNRQNPIGGGISAMFGSLDQQQQMALQAQMQALQRKNLESSMQARSAEQEMAERRLEQQASQAERRFGLQRDQFDLMQRKFDYTKQQGQQQQAQTQGRIDEVDQFIGQLPPTDDPQELMARQMMRNSMMYGTSMPRNAANVLMPEGRPAVGGGMLDFLGGAQPGMPMPGQGQVEPEPEPAPFEAESLGGAMEKQGDIDTAKQAAQNMMQRTQQASEFVNRTLIPAASGSFGFGMTAESDPKEIQSIIDKAEELWPAMNSRDRRITVQQVKRLKDALDDEL